MVSAGVGWLGHLGRFLRWLHPPAAEVRGSHAPWAWYGDVAVRTACKYFKSAMYK